jgi:gamma-glutamyltranspeptidase/glutathione hydrolase
MSMANAPTERPLLMGRRHMISAGHPLAAVAGFGILQAGGNAVDAGVAAGFALNVVHADMANLGGVAPILIRLADGHTTSIAGVGRWPRLATLDAVAAAGNGTIPTSPHRWVVPAAVDAWLTALRLYGTMSAGDVMAPAIELARKGFPVHYFLRQNLFDAETRIREWPSSAATFLPGGSVPQLGECLRQTALAETLQLLVDHERKAEGSREHGIQAARDAFYKGEIANKVDRFAQEVGAFLRADDMRNFAVSEEKPVSVSYRNRSVFACGPWSQGPAVLQMLKIAERFDIAALAPADAEHLLIETAKTALVDRNRYYGDPGFVEVPMERLLSDAHAAQKAASIDMRQAQDPRDADAVVGQSGPDTTFVCVVDDAGNAFSATPSDSTMLVTPIFPDLGFGASDRGLQASLNPRDPNAVAPGKRPRLTPNPGIVVDATSVMPYGSPGGEVQTQAMLQFLVNHVDRGLDLQAAVEAPRWASYAVPATEDPHPSEPMAVKLEAPLAESIGKSLSERGHVVSVWPRRAALAGGICAVRRDGKSGAVEGAADPRRMSYAVGW